MKDNNIPLNQPLSSQTVEATRKLYSPPNGDNYWATLEAKVMARVNSISQLRWWQVLGGWARGSLAAAAAMLLILAGMLLIQANRQDIMTAYEAFLEPEPAAELSIPSGVLTEWDGAGVEARGATFRDVISR